MRNSLVWKAIVGICLLAGTSVSARVCVLTTEPDESVGDRVWFVLPPGDPCSCTQVVLGGHNAYAPPRQDQPVYIDTLPLDVEGLRRSQGCPNESKQSDHLKQTSTSLDETTEIPVTEAQVSEPPASVTTSVSDHLKQTSTSLDETTEIPVIEAQVVYEDCQAAVGEGKTTSGVYTINKNGQFKAYCNMDTAGKGYIVIQKRYDGSVSFSRSWADYKDGFGDLKGEFWLGNDKIRRLTSQGPDWELLVTLTAFDDSTAEARYEPFSIKKESDYYELQYSFDSGYAGNAGEGFDSKKFSTFDRDNDDNDGENCADSLGGGWWFAHCTDTRSNLNGLYLNNPVVKQSTGMYWSNWKNGESLKATEMKIRQR